MYYLNPPAPITTFDGLTDFLADGEGENAFAARVNLFSRQQLVHVARHKRRHVRRHDDYEVEDIAVAARDDAHVGKAKTRSPRESSASRTNSPIRSRTTSARRRSCVR